MRIASHSARPSDNTALIHHHFGKDRITRMWGLQGHNWFFGLMTVARVGDDAKPVPFVTTRKATAR